MKINKTKCIVLLMTIISLTLLNADGFQFTPDRNLTISGGYVNSWLSGKYVDDYNSYLVGLDDLKSRHDFFIDISYLLTTKNDLLRFEPGLRYIHRGWTWWDGKQDIIDEQGNNLGEVNTHAREKLYYLDAYINYKPKLMPSVFPYIGIGYSHLLDAKIHGKAFQDFPPVEIVDFSRNKSDNYKTSNFMMMAGMEIVVKEIISLGLEYNRSINNILDWEGDAFGHENYKPKAYINSFLVSLGVKL